MMWAILDYHAKNGRQNKWNTLGKPYQPGSLEHFLTEKFDAERRAGFERVFDSLRKAGYLQSDLGDLADPGNWVELSKKGARAVERRALDSLDEELAALSPRLVEIRDGAWASLDSEEPDSLRQAADSGFELLSQTLKAAVTDEEVEKAPWFEPHPTAENGVTRDHRARLRMEKRTGTADVEACEALGAIARRLGKLKHPRRELLRGEIEVALEQAELVLQAVLVAPSKQGRD
jgi:hypothetical protein